MKKYFFLLMTFLNFSSYCYAGNCPSTDALRATPEPAGWHRIAGKYDINYSYKFASAKHTFANTSNRAIDCEYIDTIKQNLYAIESNHGYDEPENNGEVKPPWNPIDGTFLKCTESIETCTFN